jgi:uncharacterized protein YggL (DUF469 family)
VQAVRAEQDHLSASRERLVKKRWRKKLHVGEFQELGFEVCFQAADHLTSRTMP